MRRTIALVLAILGIAGAIWFLRPGQPAPWTRILPQSDRTQPAAHLGPTDARQPELGQPAPGFALRDVDGNVIRLDDFRGKTVLVNFWATWCIPCRQEFPELVSAYEQNKSEGLVVLAVDLQEDSDSVRKFAAEFGATFPIVIDAKGDVAQRYHLVGPPTTFFLDESGVLRATQIGALTEDALTRQLGQAGFTRYRGR